MDPRPSFLSVAFLSFLLYQETYMEDAQPEKKKIWDEFREFALRGNILELAVGVIVGAAFNNITNSLIKDIIMPPFGVVLNGVDFSDLFVNLSGIHYDSLQEAQAAGAATLNYGLFFNTLLNFVVISFVVFVIIKQANRLSRKKAQAPNTQTCPYCLSKIPLRATRCPECTSQLTAGS